MIRCAKKEDVGEILAMIKELADYEKAASEVVATESHIANLLFEGTSTPSRTPHAFCFVITEAEDGPLAGFAFWFLNVSTWRGTHGIYLEDLFVRPAFRGRGFGKKLLNRLIEECDANGYERLQWWVLDWNAPAIEFYRSMGAKAMDEWTVFRIERHIDAQPAQLSPS
jgi:GNAT superfamily N-acetyltransferase